MNRFLLIAVVFLGQLWFSPSAAAYQCFSSLGELRQVYPTQHAYWTKGKTCFHIRQATGSDDQSLQQKYAQEKLSSSQNGLRSKPNSGNRSSTSLRIPLPRPIPDSLSERQGMMGGMYQVTPEQGRVLLDSIFPELPTRGD